MTDRERKIALIRAAIRFGREECKGDMSQTKLAEFVHDYVALHNVEMKIPAAPRSAGRRAPVTERKIEARN